MTRGHTCLFAPLTSIHTHTHAVDRPKKNQHFALANLHHMSSETNRILKRHSMPSRYRNVKMEDISPNFTCSKSSLTVALLQRVWCMKASRSTIWTSVTLLMIGTDLIAQHTSPEIDSAKRNRVSILGRPVNVTLSLLMAQCAEGATGVSCRPTFDKSLYPIQTYPLKKIEKLFDRLWCINNSCEST